MPRGRRANIGRRTRHASQQQVYSQNLSEERQNLIRENARSLASYNRLAFQYDPTVNYSDDDNLDIGRMTTVWRYCNALKLKRETAGLCCAGGKVKLDPLLTPPQPLKPLFDGTDPDSNHFLQRILEYNNCFRIFLWRLLLELCRFVDSQLALIENVFPKIGENYQNYTWLSQRAILAAKNNDVHALNFTIQSKIDGDLVTYKSVDSITNPDDVVNYPKEFLNSLELPGLPPHNLQLKVGSVIMILRNWNPPRLCNGTRLTVKRLMLNSIEATISTESTQVKMNVFLEYQ